jgi:hypothetical protein
MNTITEKEVLASKLQKIYWIETEMEHLAVWEARIELGGEETKAIETLSNDSGRHRLTIEGWLKKANIEVPTKTPAGLPVKIMNFEGMNSSEMFRAIMKYEILLRDSYFEITKTDKDVLQSMFPDNKELETFVSEVASLVKQEEQHRRICEKEVGGFKRIRGRDH